jgi:hypothetical protein
LKICLKAGYQKTWQLTIIFPTNIAISWLFPFSWQTKVLKCLMIYPFYTPIISTSYLHYNPSYPHKMAEKHPIVSMTQSSNSHIH